MVIFHTMRVFRVALVEEFRVMHKAASLVFGCVFAAMGMTPVHGVIISTSNATQAAGGSSLPVPGLTEASNVGTFGVGSAIYLGNRYVLTAYHNQPNLDGGTVTFNGPGAFAWDGAPAVRLQNPDLSFTDIKIFRLASDPGLPTLDIASTSPSAGAAMTAIGAGRLTNATGTTYDVNQNTGPWTWTTDPPGIAPGPGIVQNVPVFPWQGSGTRALRWGTDTVDDLGGGVTTTVVNIGFGNLQVFRSTWTNGVTGHVHATEGDSGGGVFIGSTLVGMIDAIGGFSGQPGSTAVSGNVAFYGDLSLYRDQIVAIVPEPGTWGLMVVAAAGSWIMIRRRRVSR
jgi:hypothetical protein